MPEVDLGNVMGPQGVPGSQWYYGTKITGTSTTGTVFSSSGISSARVNDKYLNTSTGNIYNCTTAGAASVAKWAYIGNIKGPQGNVGPAGPTGEVDFTTPITFSVPSSRSNLASGDSIATLFGKTQKWFNDINSGGASTLLANNLSVNRALISNASGKIAASSITSTELGYLDGATSNIQDQIGTLSSLDTSAKGSLVAAVNELNGKIDWKFFGEVTGTNQLNIQDARSNANELLFIIEFSYNVSNEKVRVSYLTPALSEAYTPIFGYFYGPNDYASVACNITSNGYAYIQNSWWEVVSSGNSVSLSDSTVKLILYYR